MSRILSATLYRRAYCTDVSCFDVGEPVWPARTGRIVANGGGGDWRGDEAGGDEAGGDEAGGAKPWGPSMGVNDYDGERVP